MFKVFRHLDQLGTVFCRKATTGLSSKDHPFLSAQLFGIIGTRSNSNTSMAKALVIVADGTEEMEAVS